MARLFDPGRPAVVEPRETAQHVLQQVIRKLSLGRDARNRPVGRVNYAELGIRPLGAVYEGLLSYQAMFAAENLVQVKPDGTDISDPKTPSWFVADDRLDDFLQGEVVRVNHRPMLRRAVIHPSSNRTRPGTRAPATAPPTCDPVSRP